MIENEDHLKQLIWDVVHRTPVYDIHTHLFEPRFGDLLLWGVDELLVYHYLIAEVYRYAPMDYEQFFSLSKREQADRVWEYVFCKNSPVSEAARGVLTTLGFFNLDPGCRDLNAHRAYFDKRTPEEHIDTVFKVANLEAVVMTNDPFDDEERPVWLSEEPRIRDPRFQAALRLDGMLNDWKGARDKLKEWGYDAKGNINKNSIPGIQQFLNDWIDRMDPLYAAVSLPPDFDPFDGGDRSKLIQKCVLPVCEERNLPFAMMIGVKKLVNPALRLAGDSVGKSVIEVVEKLCVENPDNRFLVTMLARENQHELCVAARKFHNLMPFGCWWFLNDPMTIDEMTRMRMELLGLSFIPQHSDARVLDQLVYKWAHSRWSIALVLQEKYTDLWRTGWRPTEEEIQRDVTNLFGGNFKRFLGR